MSTLEERLKQQAHGLGFDLVGIAPATDADGFAAFRDWLADGRAGEMAYLERHAEARRHPRSVLAEVRTVVMVGMNYKPAEEQSSSSSAPPLRVGEGVGGRGKASAPSVASTDVVFPSTPPPSPLPETERGSGQRARIARYALGSDYHHVLRQRLNDLLAWVQSEVPGAVGRGVVDTAPLLERDFARRAGLGWFGKNTMLIHKRLGSYFFLGALLLDLELQTDPPHTAQHCGSCTACLDACPTGAFPAPGILDARKCISYLTIELKNTVPVQLRSQLGDWLFGCDVCQEVCPWNRKAPAATVPEFRPRDELVEVDPIELLGLSEEAFRQRFRDTALFRTRRRGLLRNAALVLGNRRDPAALPALRRALDDPEPLVREAASWAIDQIGAGQPE